MNLGSRSSGRLKLIADTVGAIREKKYVKGWNFYVEYIKIFRSLETRPPIRYILDVTIAYPSGQPLNIATICLGTREKWLASNF